MKKRIRIIFFAISAVLFSFCIGAPLLSACMQGYYKGLIDPTFQNDTAAILDKKQMWAEIGETKLFFILFLVFVTIFILAELFVLLSKAKSFKKS